MFTAQGPWFPYSFLHQFDAILDGPDPADKATTELTEAYQQSDAHEIDLV